MEARGWEETPNEGVLWKLNRNVAEAVWGPQVGRPTISRRTGRAISRTTGLGVETSVDLFHGVILGVGVVAALGGIAAVASTPKPKRKRR